ncbi:MAG: D-arabinono-1,4-lactone oxidase, partial [Thermocrispum sp.]
RVAAPDDIWLSTGYQRANAYVAVHQFHGMPYQDYFAAFESIVDNVGGRPHWGKMHTLHADVLRARYPRFDDFLAVRAAVDPDGLFGNAYLDQVLG